MKLLRYLAGGLILYFLYWYFSLRYKEISGGFVVILVLFAGLCGYEEGHKEVSWLKGRIAELEGRLCPQCKKIDFELKYRL